MECQYIWKIKDRQIRYPVDLSVIDRTFLRRVRGGRKIRNTKRERERERGANSMYAVTSLERVAQFLINSDKEFSRRHRVLANHLRRSSHSHRHRVTSFASDRSLLGSSISREVIDNR